MEMEEVGKENRSPIWLHAPAPPYLCSTDEADGTKASSIFLQVFQSSFDHLRMTGESKIIIGTEIQDICNKRRGRGESAGRREQWL